MKKIVFLLLAMSFVATSMAQVYVTNAYGTDVYVGKSNNPPVFIQKGEKALVSFIEPNTQQSIKVYVKIHGNYESASLTINVSGNEFVLRSAGVASSDTKEVPIVTNVKTTGLSLQNNSGHNILVVGPEGSPFLGLALAAGSASPKTNVNVGLLSITVLLDSDKSTGTGRDLRQFVIKQIVVGGQDKMVVTANDIVPIASTTEKLRIHSKFPYKVVFLTKPLLGKAVKANYWLRGEYTFPTGLNTMAIQYLKDGVLHQRNIQFIVAQGDKTLTLQEDKKDIKAETKKRNRRSRRRY